MKEGPICLFFKTIHLQRLHAFFYLFILTTNAAVIEHIRFTFMDQAHRRTSVQGISTPQKTLPHIMCLDRPFDRQSAHRRLPKRCECANGTLCALWWLAGRMNFLTAYVR